MRMSVATGTESLVCEDIERRQRLGVKKYGTTVADNPLSHQQWLQHAYEEALDMAVYLRRAIEEIDATPKVPPVEWGTAVDGERVRFTVGNQTFSLGYQADHDLPIAAQRAQLEWHRLQLDGALARLMVSGAPLCYTGLVPSVRGDRPTAIRGTEV